MRKVIVILSISLCLMAVGGMLYACADKALEVEPESEVTTRMVDETSINKYYLVLPGSSEWKALESGTDKWEASQIPGNTVQELSTPELAEACVQFPMAYDYMLVNDERFAISFFVRNFNGFVELSKRNDGLSALMEQYKTMPYDKEQEFVDGILRIYPFTVEYLELALSEESFLNKGSLEELVMLRDVALEKYREKVNSTKYYDVLSLKHTLVLLAEIMQRDESVSGEVKESLQTFVNKYQSYDEIELEEIVRLLIK